MLATCEMYSLIINLEPLFKRGFKQTASNSWACANKNLSEFSNEANAKNN